jgi:PAS domain S-box-containing protein
VEGIIIHDKGIVLDANPALGRLFGYDLSEILGQNAVDLLAAPESRETLIQEMQKKSSGPYEVVGKRKDGSRIDVEITARSLSYSGSTVRVGAIRDITDRKRAEKQERELIHEQAARAAAENAEKRAEFLSEASRVLSMSFDYHTTISQLAHLTVPVFADYCAVDVVEGQGFTRLGFAHSDPKREEEFKEKLTIFRPEDVSPEHPVMRALTLGESDIRTHVNEEGMRKLITNDEQFSVLRSLNPRSTMTVPIEQRAPISGPRVTSCGPRERLRTIGIGCRPTIFPMTRPPGSSSSGLRRVSGHCRTAVWPARALSAIAWSGIGSSINRRRPTS